MWGKLVNLWRKDWFIGIKSCCRSFLFIFFIPLSIRTLGLTRPSLFLELVVRRIKEFARLFDLGLLFLQDYLHLSQLVLFNLEFHLLLSSNYKLDPNILLFQKTCNNASNFYEEINHY